MCRKRLFFRKSIICDSYKSRNVLQSLEHFINQLRTFKCTTSVENVIEIYLEMKHVEYKGHASRSTS